MSDEMKRDGAMRLFEALSLVDEELLERSEGKKKVIPFWRYSKVMAACICLIVLGVGAYATTRVANESGTGADCAAPMENMQMMDAADANAADDAVADMEACEEYPAAEEAEAEAVMAETSGESGDLQGTIGESGTTQSSGSDSSTHEDVKDVVSAERVEEKLDDYSMEDVDGMIMDRGPIENAPERLDEESLRAEEILGDYLPTALPAGYTFTDGSRFSDADETTGISITWSKGMDYISINVREYTEEASSMLVDIAKPETYDVHLYEIPYASSVPDEVWTTFNNPIFRERDFSMEIIESRMKSVEDAGDTDTPRGQFAVLYDSGILVSFSGRGTAEEIWNLFQSIEAE